MRLQIAALFLTVTSTASFAQQAQAPAAIPVGVVVADRKPVTKTLDFVGRVEAVQKVEIRARIAGYLEKIHFKEGDLIKEGAPLYSIEKGLLDAAVGQVEGALAKDKAAQILTASQLQRADELLAKQAGTQVNRDQALAADDSAKAALVIDEANLKAARINLGYADITAPISGKVSKTNITVGNVVGPDTGPLTIIVSQDPMYVTFPVSQREFLRAQQAGKTVDITGIKATLLFSDRTPYKHPGKITFVNPIVDRATDTVLVRAEFPNPDFALVDGQLVRVSLAGANSEEKVVIPQAALISDQEGVYVFIVDQGKAAIRRVKPAGASGTGVIIDQGLAGGEQVIVEGIQGVRAEAPVRANVLPASPDRS
jgi:membrane fusion protein, multidrug efflux system